MYYLIKMIDVIRIPPNMFSEPLEEVAAKILREKYEGLIDNELGIIIAVLNVSVSDVGFIVPGDGATYHEVTFDAIAFLPKVQEVVEGEIVEVTDFGAFIRLGPIDGLIHVSQIMDDYIIYDRRRGALIGRESQKILQEGDIARARIVTVSISSKGAKVGLTMRQPFLGVLSWIEEEVKKIKGEAKPVKAKG
ncbi:MAG: DNA-directed RNA polymerase [Candidatus Methanomethylicota archaeon]|uniref:DNA-directed RNA polymerase subunit Rpo7 n=1 Tax=Thermoproteota archaeon TaxID=2056631 RepID=A0A497EWQ2_9CREN|nr:MAG: DNA-directed RNA polymerase [Candidatus Verstraetearchaeota archaeon]